MRSNSKDPTRPLAEEFGMYEYPWPKVLGADRDKWKRTAEFIDKAALNHHRHHCPGTMADGHTRQQVPPFRDDHADDHRRAVRSMLCDLLDAGIPRFLTEPASPGDGGSQT